MRKDFQVTLNICFFLVCSAHFCLSHLNARQVYCKGFVQPFDETKAAFLMYGAYVYAVQKFTGKA